MRDVIVFAGTSEGRQLYDFCVDRQIEALFSVATEYGRDVLIDRESQENAGKDIIDRRVEIAVGRLSQKEMTALFLRENPRVVVDATHPYAVEATANIQSAVERYRQAAHIEGQVYYRVLRRLSESIEERDMVFFPDMAQVVEYLNHTEGNILVTTGSKQIDELCKLKEYTRRVFLRILPSPDMLQACLDSGFPASHMICMQGPFTEEMNTAVMRQYNTCYLLTKQSGIAGGFPEKCRAAQAVGAKLVVLTPPSEQEGVSVAEMEQIILTKNNLKKESKNRNESTADR